MTDDTALTELTVDIVSAFLAHNTVSVAEVPGLISTVHASLSRLGAPVAEPESQAFEQPTAAQIRRSVSDNGIISFIDGRTYQSLKRHLSGKGLTPADYRARYGLRDDYPMVAPAYAARRSALARSFGLGQKGRQAKAAPKTAPKTAPRGRKPRA